jgi:hypothetical protein
VQSRRGISLLEVLISMFVLLVGLAGIASLLPAGRSEIMQGVKLDYAMMVGRNAFRELNARGYLKPESTPAPATYSPLGAFTATNGWFHDGTLANKIFRPDVTGGFRVNSNPVATAGFMLDPLSVFAFSSPDPVYGNLFPRGINPSQPFLARISPFGTLTGVNAKLISDMVFRCPDDASIKVNTITKNGPPLRQEVPFGSSGTGVMKMGNNGAYSWFATIVPDPSQSLFTGKVIVSVAVVYKRDLSIAGAGESFCRVISLPGLGISGGEVILWKPAKALRPGQWVMMAGFDDTSGTRRDFFYWYKVLAASPITKVNQLPSLSASKPSDVSSNDDVQPLTLAGPDWGRNLFPATVNTATTIVSPTGWPTAFIVDNVIAVYEKSMDLEF